MVGEWLPQTIIFSIAPTGLPVLAASCDSARLWSRRSIAVKFFAGRRGADFIAIQALVLAGLPTTSTLMSRDATALIALPCSMNIFAFSISRSLRSMPGPRGLAPTSSA